MDFSQALRHLREALDVAGARWAVIGGLALAAHGAGRLTYDLDIVTELRVQPELVDHLESLGYETMHRSEGYSNHVHRRREMGRIDVVYVDETTARILFTEATEVELFPGVPSRIPQPEHLVAMKVLAAKNDPTRRLQEMADIVTLMRATGLEPDVVRPYFERHGQLESWRQIRDSL